jgi:hypothetical protein
MNKAIKAEVQTRGISRLCHFTPSRNFAQILTGNVGILATKKLTGSERTMFNPTDLARLDGFLDHICCSMEYPNAWYFDKARAKELLFKDWVILFIDPKYLWATDAKFSPRNAAANGGMYVSGGEAAFRKLFADKVPGAYGKTYIRTPKTPAFCTTDEQAEVLIPDVVSLGDVIGCAVQSETQARNEIVRMELLKVPSAVRSSLKIIVAPVLFDKYALSAALKNGERPQEVAYHEAIG